MWGNLYMNFKDQIIFIMNFKMVLLLMLKSIIIAMLWSKDYIM